jgi:glycosyltransferase involved in cell wall biosynthesis
MKVVLVHNRHRERLPSGENSVVDDELGLLRDSGVDVTPYFRSNDEIDRFGPAGWAMVPLRQFHSPEDVRAFGRVLREVQPDIVHLHNPYALISPSIVRVAHREGVPVVHSVHNYTQVCAAGTYFRYDAAAVCHRCQGRRVLWPAVRHACYHESRAQSAVFAAAIMAARRVWPLVSRFLPVSHHVAEHLLRMGIPGERITVKPNSLPDPGPASPPGEGFLFASRLRSEKGVRMLLQAWELSGLGQHSRLTVAGDGPERAFVEQQVRRLTGVEYVGRVSRAGVAELLGRAGVLVQPSRCEESFSMTKVEALAHGRPVLATALGGLVECLDSEVGWLVEPNPEALAAGLRAAASADLARLGQAARRRYQERLSPAVVTTQLLGVYEELSAERRP